MRPSPLIRLDSSHPDERTWPWPATHAGIVLRCDAANLETTLHRGEHLLATWKNPLEALGWLGSADAWSDRETPHARDRWIGFLSYDLGRLFETISPQPARGDELPLFAFARCREEHAPAGSDPDTGHSAAMPISSSAALRSTFTPAGYRAAVGRVIDYIRAGDVFQVNLSQRFTLPCRIPLASVYARLLRDSPAHYGGLLDFGDFALISNSPELFLRTGTPSDGRRRIITRPIKGTRPCLSGMDVQLRDSVKDQAELNMIVDLERNDLGRICEIGTVKVTQPRTIEAHPTVYHGVATVEGILRPDVNFVDILGATFPGGSVTGAPKIRAMQIIDELEPVSRGPYCGAIGHLSADGSMEFNVAIRTMIVRDGQAHVPVGGGIVADSDPAAEYEETLVKARAMFTALGVSAEDPL
ncbi:MAG TPA: anthranilate synthase component I family protein [Tepidisphaeraceae bacterium]|nr:anthranilate synthase component I family protein [Tepidisphaeraceae bacterium]